MTARERLQERMENLEEFASRANSAAGFLETCRELWGKLDDEDKGVLTDRVCKNLVKQRRDLAASARSTASCARPSITASRWNA